MVKLYHGDVGVAVTRQLVELELGVRLPYISQILASGA